MKKDEKLEEIKRIVEDAVRISENFEESERIVEYALELTSEAARIAVITEVLKKTAEIKDTFMNRFLFLEQKLNDTQEELLELYSQREEVMNQLAKQRIITADLLNQVVNIRQILLDANMSEETLNKLLKKTRDFHIQCSSCEQTRHGTLDEIHNASPCENCGDKGTWEIRLMMLA